MREEQRHLATLAAETTGKLNILGLCETVSDMIGREDSDEDIRMVTRLAWMAQRLVSSKRETR
jgi:hypothetical protein